MSEQIEEAILSKTNFGFNERPLPGYTYIYIYSRDDIFIYVGQTIQSVSSRYRNHLSDNSGAHYANRIYCIQIMSNYANYAEGYLAHRLDGISQGNVPNYEHYKDTPESVKTILRKIGNTLCSQKLSGDCKNQPYIFSFFVEADGNYDTLKFLSKLVREHNILWDNFLPAMKENSLCFSDLWLRELIYKKTIQVYMLSSPQAGQRPICFFLAKSALDIKEINKIKANFPFYCVIDFLYYKKYEKMIHNIFSKTEAGILLCDWNNVLEQKKYTKIYGRKNMKCTDLVGFFGKTEYRVQKSPYGYFQCA